MATELLIEILQEFHEKMENFDLGICRDVEFSNIKNKIAVAIGMRRTGKTYLLMQKILQLMEDNIPLSQILYLNFEDDRLLPMNQEKLRHFIDEFYSLYPRNHDGCYFFFDEIQNVEGWPLLIRRYLDTKKIAIYLTGSSAKLLSKEIATSLRGRSLATEVWPFNFKEFLTAKNISINLKLPGKKNRDQIKKYLKLYLIEGGFPEAVNLALATRIRLLQDYVNVVIFRDVIERHHITNISLVHYLIKMLLGNVGTSFSVNKVFNDLKSQGFAVSKTTIHDYLSYLEDVFLIFTVPLFSDSVRKTQTNPRKIYAIDSGLANAYIFNRDKNIGHWFENLIYLDLRRAGYKIYYYLTKDRYEIDFLTIDFLGKFSLIQVAWDVKDHETMQREQRALRCAEEELGVNGILLTSDNYVNWLLSLEQTILA